MGNRTLFGISFIAIIICFVFYDRLYVIYHEIQTSLVILYDLTN